MIKHLSHLLVLFFIGSKVLFAQNKVITINQKLNEIEVIDAIDYLLDSSGTLTFNKVITSNSFKPLNKSSIAFGSVQAYLWLKFKVSYQGTENKNYSLVTKGIDSLLCYQLSDSTQQIIHSQLTGSHIPFSNREFQSPYLTFNFEVEPSKTYTILVRIRNVNYPLSASPFKILSHAKAKIFIKQKDLQQSIYIGIMIFLLLFGSALLFFFKEALYLYYLLCVFFSMLMMLAYNEYYYLIFDTVPEIIRNKNFFGIPTSIVPIFYLLFAKEFLVYGYDRNRYLRVLIYGFSAATFLVISIFLFFNINFYANRFIIYFFIFGVSSLTLILLFRSLIRKYQPAWFFLIATVPVNLVAILETISEFHHIPVQTMHAIYYTSTVVEMFILTLGLAYKFKVSQDEKKKVQAEVYATEIQVQENERQRIAQDLHDKIGGLLGALKIKLSVLSSKGKFEEHDFQAIEKSLEMLDLTSEEVRNISHSLASSTLTKLGLVAMLKEMYAESENPKVLIQNNGFTQRLNPSKEMALYAIIQECINNARKHAGASEISVGFKQVDDKLTVMIEDDGNGFDLKKNVVEGKGLENVTFRVKEHLKGEFIIDSNVGSGTVILVKTKI